MGIENTTKNPRPEWLFGLNPQAIESQEAEGQKQLCNSSQLPHNANCEKDAKEIYLSLGIKVIGESKDDNLFYDVELPKGWKICPANHSMWSELQNEQGKTIGTIFYKAAFYDRCAVFHKQEIIDEANQSKSEGPSQATAGGDEQDREAVSGAP